LARLSLGWLRRFGGRRFRFWGRWFRRSVQPPKLLDLVSYEDVFDGVSPALAKLGHSGVGHAWRDRKVSDQKVPKSVLAFDEMPIRTARDEDQAVVARSSFSENVHTPRHHALPQAMVKRFLRSAFAHRASAARRNTAWDATRLKVQQKADERRRQGFIGPTMASHAELAYTGIVDALAALDPEFMLRRETGQGQPREEAVARGAMLRR
jgi:hypothetical protein